MPGLLTLPRSKFFHFLAISVMVIPAFWSRSCAKRRSDFHLDLASSSSSELLARLDLSVDGAELGTGQGACESANSNFSDPVLCWPRVWTVDPLLFRLAKSSASGWDTFGFFEGLDSCWKGSTVAAKVEVDVRAAAGLMWLVEHGDGAALDEIEKMVVVLLILSEIRFAGISVLVVDVVFFMSSSMLVIPFKQA